MEGFRTLVRGWVGKVLMALLSLPFILFGVESYFSGGNHNEIAATIDKKDISRRELDQKVDEQRKSLLPKVGGDADLIDDSVLRQQVLDNLIAQSVILNQANKLGLTMTDNQIVAMLHKEPSFQKDGKFSDELFQAYLKNSGQDRFTLFKMVREQTSLSLMAQSIAATSVTGGSEIDRIMKLQTEKRDVQLATILASPYLAQVNVTDAQIRDYYNANKAHLNSLEQVNLDYVTLDSSSLANQVKVTDQDLQARYQAMVQTAAGNEQRHAQHILIATDKIGDAAAKKKIDSLAAQIKAGADFGALAKANSDDQGSAINNGDLGLVTNGIYGAEFDKALNALTPNQVSEPIKTPSGYDLIKLLDIKKADVPSFDSVKAQLMVEANQAKLDAAYGDAQSQINEQAVSADSLVDLAKSHNLSISHSGLIGRTGIAGDFSNKDLLTTAFSDESTKDRKVSSGLTISPTRTMWIQVTQYSPVKPLTLAEATPKIRATLQMQGALALAKAKAKEVAASLNSGKTIEQTAAATGVTFQNMGEVTRDKGLPSAVLSNAAFSITAPAAGRTNANTVSVASGVVVLAVSKVTDEATAITPEQRKQIQTSLNSLRGQQELEDYVEYLKGQAKVEKFSAKKASS
ncbi:MAG: SurA N-terminal domain-containing protein [Gammaproteobacteria bacterium]|nr:SurA N-terminal domain-containing protein [Gammaproteobacteria bacterium]